MDITKTISTQLDSLKNRVVKVLRFGKTDIRTAKEAAPYGTDSNPIKGMTAVYAQTSNKRDRVIVGYLNKNQLADVGEHRIFSTDSNGDLQFYVWLKSDGTMQLGGNEKHLARFEELKSGFDALREDHNALLQEFKVHTHPGVTTGAGVTGVPVSTSSPSTASIDDSKIAEIKTL
jgi:hypothetical protein